MDRQEQFKDTELNIFNSFSLLPKINYIALAQ